MKDLKFLVWLTQLGISVAAPMAGFVLLAVWLRNNLSLGNWVMWVGIILGIVFAIDSLRHSLHLLARLTEPKEKTPPPVSFNDHH